MRRPLHRRRPRPLLPSRAALWLPAGLLAGLAACADPGTPEGGFTLDLSLYGAAEPDPFQGVSYLRVDFAYADGEAWSVYWEDPSGGSRDFEGVPGGEGVVLTVTALREDDLYPGNALAVSSGVSVPVDLAGAAATSVLVGRIGALSTGPAPLAVARTGAELAAFEDGTLVVIGGLPGREGTPAIASLEVARTGGEGPLLDPVPFGDLPRAFHAVALAGEVAAVWGGVTEVGGSAFDATTGDAAAGGVALVRPAPGGGQPEVRVLDGAGTPGRWAVALAALPDGRFVALGGLASPAMGAVPEAVGTVEVLDPAAEAVVALDASLSTPRAFARALHLGAGQVLVTGGFGAGGNGAAGPVVAGSELWSEAGGAVPAGSLAAPRALHDVALLGPGRLLVAGGVGDDGEAVAAAEVYTFDPGNPGAGLRLDSSPPLIWPRWGARLTVLPGGGALLCGGEDSAGPVAPCERFGGEGDGAGFSPLMPPDGDAGDLPEGLWEGAAGTAAAVLPGGGVVLAGGWDGQPSGEVRLFTP
ncbi:hypothetical protein L6R50_19260 [Myxococcota bacterium]|nr:hypothetical protein [Myxococcota bacterium]